jgi:serine/threonine protein phosphatase PrpC
MIVDRALNFFAVADGHGHSGERVSGFLKLWIPRNFAKFLKQKVSRDCFIKSFI